jgi:hypothetical protein
MGEFHFNQAKLDEFVLLHQSSHGGLTFWDVISLHSQRFQNINQNENYILHIQSEINSMLHTLISTLCQG